ncbi:MAG: TetR/AcrR family transcriptional regulator [Candidatus Binatia bacterium]
MTDVSSTRVAAQAKRTAFTERRILDAAETLFSKRGLDGTRVREIAEAAGVNGATLYNYYPSKRALYEAVMDRGMRPLIAFLAEFSGGPRNPESIRALVKSVMAHLTRHPRLSRLVYLEAIAEGDYLQELARRWFSPLLGQIMDELEAGPALEPLAENFSPVVAALFVHLSFGHFALAPLLHELFQGDPLSAEGVAKQTRFIETLISRMFPRLADSPLRPG